MYPPEIHHIQCWRQVSTLQSELSLAVHELCAEAIARLCFRAEYQAR